LKFALQKKYKQRARLARIPALFPHNSLPPILPTAEITHPKKKEKNNDSIKLIIQNRGLLLCNFWGLLTYH